LPTPALGIVHVSGTIVPGEVGAGPFGDGGLAGGDTVARHIREARRDRDVRAIVLRVDSPGGAVSASDVILREVERAAAIKPVIVSMSDVAASGGYWISTGAARILADRATFTGSIGVVSARFNLAEAYEKIGVGNAVVKRGENADLFVESERLSDSQRQVLGESVELHYRTFLEKVADARGLSIAEVEELAAGQVWTGQEALERQLIDGIGGLHAALQAARQEAGIDLDEAFSIKEFPAPASLFEGILGFFGQSRSASPSAFVVGGEIVPREILDRARLLESLTRGGRLWALDLTAVPAPAR
jgi:protease-4